MIFRNDTKSEAKLPDIPCLTRNGVTLDGVNRNTNLMDSASSAECALVICQVFVKKPKVKKWLCLLLFLFIGIIPLNAQNVKVVITGIRSPEGQIIIGVYKNEQSFKEDKPFERKKFKKHDIINGKMTVNLNLSPGTYGFALLDGENDDDEMNYNFIGIPKEGFGFSNYYQTSLTRPKFDVFKFEVKKDRSQKVVCRIKYML